MTDRLRTKQRSPESMFAELHTRPRKGEGYFVALDALALAEFLALRQRLRCDFHGFTGISSDALVVAAITGEGPWITDYPSDRADWRRCLLAYALAPPFLRERMRPIMREYRSKLEQRHSRMGFGKHPRADFLREADLRV